MDADKHLGTTNLYKILQVDSKAHITDGIICIFSFSLTFTVKSFIVLFQSEKKLLQTGTYSSSGSCN